MVAVKARRRAAVGECYATDSESFVTVLDYCVLGDFEVIAFVLSTRLRFEVEKSGEGTDWHES